MERSIDPPKREETEDKKDEEGREGDAAPHRCRVGLHVWLREQLEEREHRLQDRAKLPVEELGVRAKRVDDGQEATWPKPPGSQAVRWSLELAQRGNGSEEE